MPEQLASPANQIFGERDGGDGQPHGALSYTGQPLEKKLSWPNMATGNGRALGLLQGGGARAGGSCADEVEELVGPLLQRRCVLQEAAPKFLAWELCNRLVLQKQKKKQQARRAPPLAAGAASRARARSLSLALSPPPSVPRAVISNL